jgi:hypothetical protein
MDNVMLGLELVFDEHAVGECHYELPVFYDDAGGHMAAKKGDLGKLLRSVGRIEELCRSRDVRYVEHSVPQWKGQMSKDLVNRRICRVLDSVCFGRAFDRLVAMGCRTHAWDAVGIGLYAKGCLAGPPPKGV